MKRFVSFLLVVAMLVVMIPQFTLAAEPDSLALNEVDAAILDISIQVLEDASYQGIDLVHRMYQHAFSCGIQNYIPEDALAQLAAGTASDALKAMVVPCDDLTESVLMTGDILFAGDKLYLYGAGSLRSLNGSGAPKVNTAETLASITDFTLLRPALAMTNMKRSDVNAQKDVLTPQQEALVATAKAYWLRGERLQYADTRFVKNGKALKAEFRWQSTVNAPEDCTLTDWGYTNCAAFTYEVYYQTFGYKLPDNMYTTANLAANAAANGMEVFAYDRTAGSTQTEAEQAQIKEAFLSTLQPGDIICIRRENGSGHALLYIGDGQIIHASGSTYNYSGSYGVEAYEASIRRVLVENYFFNPEQTANGDVFGVATKLSVVRPLQVMNEQITENTRNRMENLENIVAEKISSHVRAQTADKGEMVTFTYALHNVGDQAVTLQVKETVPAQLEWVSGGERNGSELTWSVTVPAEGRASVSYTAKVKETVSYGTKIHSADSTVGGVTVKCEPITVGKKLTTTQQTALVQAFQNAKTNGTTLTGLALVNELYKLAAGVEAIFADTEFTTVTEGAEGCFRYYTTDSSKTIYERNPGSQYAQLLAPSLYGGYRLWASEFANDRTRLAREQDLQIGDVLLGRTSSSQVIYLYLGEDIGFVSMSTLAQDSVSVAGRLERILAYGNYYAVMRPMQALQPAKPTPAVTVYLDPAAGSDSADGLTEATAVNSYETAFAKVKAAGSGTIVFLSDLEITEDMRLPSSASNVPVVLTSKDGSQGITGTIDIRFNAPTTLENMKVKLAEASSSRALYGEGKKLVIGEGVTCVGTDGYYFSLAGGKRWASCSSTDLTVQSGTWRNIYVGTRGYKSGATVAGVTGNAKLTMTGGTLTGYITPAYGNSAVIGGDVDIDLSNMRAAALYCSPAYTATVEGNVNVTLGEGATFTGTVFTGGDGTGSVTGKVSILLDGADTSDYKQILVGGDDGFKGSVGSTSMTLKKGVVGVDIKRFDTATLDVAQGNTLTVKNVSVEVDSAKCDGTLAFSGTATLNTKAVSGALNCDVDGAVIQNQKYVIAPAGSNVIFPVSTGVKEDNGVWEYRNLVQLEYVVIRPSAAGIYYVGQFNLDASQRENVESYGVVLSLNAEPALGKAGCAYSELTTWPENGAGYGTLLTGIMTKERTYSANKAYSETTVYGVAYIKYKDGTVVYSNYAQQTLRQTVEAADDIWSELSQSQKDALITMYRDYFQIMHRWDIPNIKEAA